MSNIASRKNSDLRTSAISKNCNGPCIRHHSYVPSISLPLKLPPSVSELIDLDHRYHPIYPSSSTEKTGFDSVRDMSLNRSSAPDLGMTILQDLVLRMKEPKYKKGLMNCRDNEISQSSADLGGYCNYLKERRGEWAKARS